MNSCIWILLLLSCCGQNNGCGCGRTGRNDCGCTSGRSGMNREDRRNDGSRGCDAPPPPPPRPPRPPYDDCGCNG